MNIPNPFWNREERRIRAVWRLLLQTVILVIGLFLFGLLYGVVLLLMGFLTPGSGSTFSGSLVDSQQGATALIEAANASWWFRLLSSFGISLVIVLSIWLAGIFVDRRHWRDFGFHFGSQWWRDFIFGLGLGALLMSIIFLIEWAAGWVTISGTFWTPRPGESFLAVILIALGNFILVGIREEMLARGYHLRNLAEGLNWRWWNPRVALLLAWFLSSAVFGLMHAANPNTSVLSTANLVLAGLLIGFGYVLTGELAIPIGLHITWNFFEGNVYGFPVSGLGGMPSFIAIQQGGPDLWTGGAFGPEAGLLNVVIFLVGISLTWLWVWRTRGSAALKANLAQYRRLPAGQTGEPGETADAGGQVLREIQTTGDGF